MTAPQKLSIRHESILDFIIANPKAKLGQVAREFGLGQSQLSLIIHSDVFQDKLAEKRAELNSMVLAPHYSKMMAIADAGLEKIAEQMEVSNDKEYITDTTIKMLDRTGSGPKGGGAQPNGGGNGGTINGDVYVVSPDVLAAARAKIGRTIEHSPMAELLEAPATEKVVSLPAEDSDA